MSEYRKIQENIFTEIGKLLSLPTIKKILNQKEDSDPSLSATLKAIKRQYQDLQKDLPAFCKKYPESPACKNLKGK